MDPRAEVTLLAREVDLLEKRADLAAADTFYVVIDPSDRRLLLMLEGAVLRDYEILGLEVGTPRVAYRARTPQGGWVGRIWSHGELDPARDRERTEIVPPDAEAAADTSKPAAAVVPPTPEEAYPVPHRYHVRYAGGLSLEVRPRELDESVKVHQRALSKLRVWWRDLQAAVHREPEDRIRLRLVLRPEDAASLYRALPPVTRLLVLPSA